MALGCWLAGLCAENTAKWFTAISGAVLNALDLDGATLLDSTPCQGGGGPPALGGVVVFANKYISLGLTPGARLCRPALARTASDGRTVPSRMGQSSYLRIFLKNT